MVALPKQLPFPAPHGFWCLVSFNVGHSDKYGPREKDWPWPKAFTASCCVPSVLGLCGVHTTMNSTLARLAQRLGQRP